MAIFVTGATGFVGRPLVQRLQSRGETVVVQTRRPEMAEACLPGVKAVDGAASPCALQAALAPCRAVINLQGENLFSGRWTPARKEAIVRSRVDATERLARALRAVTDTGPKVFVSTSGVGFYGAHVPHPVTESAPAGTDFLAQLCQAWEAATDAGPHVRRVQMRLGIVLGAGGGALAKMLPIFRLGLGGRLGNGQQPFPWIHRGDVVSLLLAACDDPRYAGPINAVAPEAVDQATFARTLGQVLHRPACLPLPGGVLRTLAGDASDVILGGQNAKPAAAEALGFPFAHPTLRGSLEHIVKCCPADAA